MSIRIVARRWNLAGGARVRILLRGQTHGEQKIELELSATVLTLKRRLSEKIGVPPSELLIIFGDVMLQDNATLEAEHVREGSALRYEFKSSSLGSSVREQNAVRELTFVVRTPNSRNLKVVVPETATVRDFKSKLYEREPSLARENIQLAVGQISLQDGADMSEFEGSEVQAISGLPGGL